MYPLFSISVEGDSRSEDHTNVDSSGTTSGFRQENSQVIRRVLFMVRVIMGMKVASSIFAMGMIAGMGALAMCRNRKSKNTDSERSDSNVS